MSSSRPDPNRKSFWQFQRVAIDPSQSGPNARMTAVFRHCVENFGEVTPSHDIAYPNVRSFTMAELIEIRDAPLHPKAPKMKPESAEKNRMMVNVARAGLTQKEFGRAMEAMDINAAAPVTHTTHLPLRDERQLKAA